MIQRAQLLAWGGAVPPEVGDARGSFAERKGLLLVLVDGEGCSALGEATPLPGGAESLDLSGAAIAAFPWRSTTVPRSPAELAPLLQAASLPPAAAFAIDSALAALAARGAGISIAAWLCTRPPERVARSVFVGRIGQQDTLARAVMALQRGVGTLKVKAPCRDIAAEVRWLLGLRETLGPEVRLRLDCNGALAVEDAPDALKAFSGAGLELVEEPCSYESLLALGELAVPWFVDESLARPELRARFLAHPHVAGLVLKPTLIGGLVASLDLADRALAAGKQVLVTHAFEGPVALAACAELSVGLGSRARAPGLDRHAGLEAFPPWDLPQLRADGAFVEPTSSGKPLVPEHLVEVWSWTR